MQTNKQNKNVKKIQIINSADYFIIIRYCFAKYINMNQDRRRNLKPRRIFLYAAAAARRWLRKTRMREGEGEARDEVDTKGEEGKEKAENG